MDRIDKIYTTEMQECSLFSWEFPQYYLLIPPIFKARLIWILLGLLLEYDPEITASVPPYDC